MTKRTAFLMGAAMISVAGALITFSISQSHFRRHVPKGLDVLGMGYKSDDECL